MDLEFLKPDWKKFILPIVLIIIYFFLIGYFSRIGDVMDAYTCERISIREKIIDAVQNNESAEAYMEESRIQMEKWRLASENLDVDNIIGLYNLMKFIDPFIPSPCEFTASNYCVHYSSQETFDCITNFVKVTDEPSGLIAIPINIEEYRRGSFFTHIPNFLILIMEGYLISALVILFYKKIKNRTREREV